MKMFLFITLFILGFLFLNAAHIPAWMSGSKRPSHANWKRYAMIGIAIWVLLLILANTIL